MLWVIDQHKKFFKTPLSYTSANQLKIIMEKKSLFKKIPKNKINKNVFRKHKILLKPQVNICKYRVEKEKFLK